MLEKNLIVSIISKRENKNISFNITIIMMYIYHYHMTMVVVGIKNLIINEIIHVHQYCLQTL